MVVLGRVVAAKLLLSVACALAPAKVLPVSTAQGAARLPPLGYRLFLKAPRTMRVGQSGVYYVGVQHRFKEIAGTRWGGYYVDFALSGGWQRSHIRTSDGSSACGGDIVPQQPRQEGTSHYWHLDFGDCRSGIYLVLIPTKPGPHAFVIRPFVAPVSGGRVLLSKKVIEMPFAVHWYGHVLR